MCGRFNILTDIEALMSTFEILEQNAQINPFEFRYNVSPTPRNTLIESFEDFSLTQIPIVKLGVRQERDLCDAIWPFVPIWAGNLIPKYATANARSETMHKLASYRTAWKQNRRCLIPATGFYEWQRVPQQNRKQPWHIQHKEHSIMSFAGLWESGVTAKGEEFISCTIVTTKANTLMSEIHNTNQRMPVIVDPEQRDRWLGGSKESVLDLLESYADDRLQAYPISTKINFPKYSKEDCVEPIELNGVSSSFQLTS